MAGALMKKGFDLFGMDQAEQEDYEDEEEVEDKKIFGRRNNKVVNMPQSQSQAIKMVISQPTNFMVTMIWGQCGICRA